MVDGPAVRNLTKTLDALPKFVSHSIGPTPGTTSSLELTALTLLRAGAELKRALFGEPQQVLHRLDEFEGSFQLLISMRGSIGHSTTIFNMSDQEVEEMLSRIDAVRHELTSKE